jgi:hypothetical protein
MGIWRAPDDAQTPTGRVVVVADTTEVSDSSSALPDDVWTPPPPTDTHETRPKVFPW